MIHKSIDQMIGDIKALKAEQKKLEEEIRILDQEIKARLKEAGYALDYTTRCLDGLGMVRELSPNSFLDPRYR